MYPYVPFRQNMAGVPILGNGHQSILVLLYILVGGFKHVFFLILTISYMGCHPSH